MTTCSLLLEKGAIVDKKDMVRLLYLYVHYHCGIAQKNLTPVHLGAYVREGDGGYFMYVCRSSFAHKCTCHLFLKWSISRDTTLSQCLAYKSAVYRSIDRHIAALGITCYWVHPLALYGAHLMLRGNSMQYKELAWHYLLRRRHLRCVFCSWLYSSQNSSFLPSIWFLKSSMIGGFDVLVLRSEVWRHFPGPIEKGCTCSMKSWYVLPRP